MTLLAGNGVLVPIHIGQIIKLMVLLQTMVRSDSPVQNHDDRRLFVGQKPLGSGSNSQIFLYKCTWKRLEPSTQHILMSSYPEQSWYREGKKEFVVKIYISKETLLRFCRCLLQLQLHVFKLIWIPKFITSFWSFVSVQHLIIMSSSSFFNCTTLASVMIWLRRGHYDQVSHTENVAFVLQPFHSKCCRVHLI